MTLIARLLASQTLTGRVADVRIGTHWTAVVVETAAENVMLSELTNIGSQRREASEASFTAFRTGSPSAVLDSTLTARRGALWPADPLRVTAKDTVRAGLAATQIVHDLEHGQPAVRDAGKLIGRDARELAELAKSDSLTERSLGFATLNALLEVDEAACVARNAEDLILERGRGRRIAIVGHFPFVPRVREAAQTCWVLELAPGPGDLPAEMAPEVIPRADVVAITGMTLVNGTFEALTALCRPDAFVLVLGPSTPLSSLLFEYGVSAISGTVVEDIPSVLTAVSQGATFRQIPGRRLLTMIR